MCVQHISLSVFVLLHTYVSPYVPYSSTLCIHAGPAGLFGIDLGRPAWVSSQGKIEAARCRGLGYRRYHYPKHVADQNGSPPKWSFIKVDPHPCWGGVYQLNGRPAARRGIKRQVERKRISWLEWGGKRTSADTHRLADTFTLWNCLSHFLSPLLLQRNRKPRSASPCVCLNVLHKISDLYIFFSQLPFYKILLCTHEKCI